MNMNVYRIDDMIKCDFYRIPKAFYANPEYRKMSAEAKLTYARLYDLLSLSQKNGWINENGEVYLCLSRRKLAEELGICEKTATKIFKELTDYGLIVDVQLGQGKNNRIYIVKPEVSTEEAKRFTENKETGTEKVTGQRSDADSADADNTPADPKKLRLNDGNNDVSRTEKFTGQDRKKVPTIKTDNSKTDLNYTENSQSVTDRQLFNKILAQCQLEHFDRDIRRIFYDAIERLFYCRELKIGTSVLPGENVRSRLCELDSSVLETALVKMHRNQNEIKNSTGYVMSVIFNCLTEGFTETHLDPYLNHLRGGVTNDVFKPLPEIYSGIARRIWRSLKASA